MALAAITPFPLPGMSCIMKSSTMRQHTLVSFTGDTTYRPFAKIRTLTADKRAKVGILWSLRTIQTFLYKYMRHSPLISYRHGASQNRILLQYLMIATVELCGRASGST